MKLIFCPACKDIRQIRLTPTTCYCGESGGQYREDGLHADIWGHGVALGINNDNFSKALAAYDLIDIGIDFTAWVIQEDCETVHRLE